MKCVKFGTLGGSGGTVNITDLGFTSAEDYMVIITGDGMPGAGYGTYISAKTATSFTVSSNANSPGISYQVISFVS